MNLQQSPKVIAYLEGMGAKKTLNEIACIAKLCANEALVFASYSYGGEPLFTQGSIRVVSFNGTGPRFVELTEELEAMLEVLHRDLVNLVGLMPPSRQNLEMEEDFAVVIMEPELSEV